MPETREHTSPETPRAVCFDRRDYAGRGRRVAIICIDLVGAAVLCFVVFFEVAFFCFLQNPSTDDLPSYTLLLLLLVICLYFTVLKRSEVGTLGYMFMGVRIVNIEGKKPSMLQMTGRMLPLLLLPLALPFDLAWVVDDPQRQTLRDKWVGTFVVRRNAQPIGTAPVRYKRIGFAGLFLSFPEIGPVERLPQPSPPQGLKPL
jgi:uncharacterized RDD family membrane protein YckC